MESNTFILETTTFSYDVISINLFMNSSVTACKWSTGWLPILVVVEIFTLQVPRVAVTVFAKMNVCPFYSLDI